MNIREMRVSERLYEQIFQTVRIHLCEECKCLFLPDEVVQRSQSFPGSNVARQYHVCKDCARKEAIPMPEVTGGKFPTGRLVMTTHLKEVLEESDAEGWQDDLNKMVAQHIMGEWGEVDEHDTRVNNEALAQGGRLLSAYTSAKGIKVWIITEHDRSYTTCLLPEDY